MVEDNHNHNGINSVRLTGRSFVNAPQSALTTATSPATLTTGGSNDLKTADATILQNAITRIAEIEARLQALELIR